MLMDPPEGLGTPIRTCPERLLIRSDADLLVCILPPPPKKKDRIAKYRIKN